MGSLWSRQAWLDSCEVKLHEGARVVRVWLRTIIDSIESLGLQVSLDHFDLVRISSDEV